MTAHSREGEELCDTDHPCPVSQMAPRRGESIEPSDERNDFVEKLVEYHEKRGTSLDLGQLPSTALR